jgi:hypothetical protein
MTQARWSVLSSDWRLLADGLITRIDGRAPRFERMVLGRPGVAIVFVSVAVSVPAGPVLSVAPPRPSPQTFCRHARWRYCR